MNHWYLELPLNVCFVWATQHLVDASHCDMDAETDKVKLNDSSWTGAYPALYSALSAHSICSCVSSASFSWATLA